VVNAYQFERAALNVMLSFDADNKIAGMNITPRPAPPAASDAAARVEPFLGGVSDDWRR